MQTVCRQEQSFPRLDVRPSRAQKEPKIGAKGKAKSLRKTPKEALKGRSRTVEGEKESRMGTAKKEQRMAVELYFGLPGAGKTTMLCYKAIQAKKSKRYKHIYSNVRVAIDGVTYIDNDCIGKYALRECLILIDEATLFADSRAHKTFDAGKIIYFLEHRHMKADIILFTQQWDGVDKKIRVITDRVYYVYKGGFTGKWFTRCYRIPYGIIIPDPKKDGSEKLGEIVQGYCKPNFLVRLFSPWLYRPSYYKYFDSWEEPYFPELPESYKPYKDADGAREPKAARAARIYYQTYINPEPIPREFEYLKMIS